jgi:hypothetical protein
MARKPVDKPKRSVDPGDPPTRASWPHVPSPNPYNVVPIGNQTVPRPLPPGVKGIL